MSATEAEKIQELEDKVMHLEEALIWCSAAPAFAVDGEARVGWEKLCRPLLETISVPQAPWARVEDSP